MTLELSDAYERMPSEFRKVVLKSHNRLSELIEFYSELTTKNKKFRRSVNFKSWVNIFQPPSGTFSCSICYQSVASKLNLNSHMRLYHGLPDSSIANPKPDPNTKLLQVKSDPSESKSLCGDTTSSSKPSSSAAQGALKCPYTHLLREGMCPVGCRYRD